jgi:hypothetical protein
MQLDCRKCSDQDKAELGCEEESIVPGGVISITSENLNFTRCPLKIVTSVSLEYLRAYRYFSKGYLPDEGGWRDQSAKFLHAMDIIDSELGKIQEEEIRRAQDAK